MSSDADTLPVAPPVADGVVVRWLDPAASWLVQVGGSPAGTRLAPAIVARAALVFEDRKLNVRQSADWTGVAFPLGASFDPTTVVEVAQADSDLRDEAPTGVVYLLTDAPLKNKTYFSGAQKGIADQLYRTQTHPVLRNRDLDLTAEVTETSEAFAARCQVAATAAAQQAKTDLQAKFQSKLARAQDAVGAANDRVAQAQAAESTRKTSALASSAGALLGAVLGRRRNPSSVARDIGTALGGSGRSAEASRRVQSAQNQLQRKMEAFAAVQEDLTNQLNALDQAWATKAAAVETVDVALRKSDIRITALSLVWVPVA